MARRFIDWWDDMERRARKSFGRDHSTALGRLAGRIHTHLFDHAFLRTFWTNFDEVAPGVFRSNQPSHRRWGRYARRGIRSVLNLRGDNDQPVQMFARERTEALGLQRYDVRLSARSAPPRDRLLEVFDIFDRIEKPFVMHCKSGSDRTGLVAALWLLDQEGVDLATARRELSMRYLHRKDTRTGVLDAVLDAYEADTGGPPHPVRDWVRDSYDPQAVQAAFDAKLARR